MDSQRPVKLTVLKAFHLGSRLATHWDRSTALEMIERALTHFGPSTARPDRVKLLFYSLLKAEMLRDQPGVIPARATVRKLSDELDSQIFDYYMAVEASSAAHAVGRDSDYEAGRALGIDTHSLTRNELAFMRQLSLAAIIEHHQVPSGD